MRKHQEILKRMGTGDTTGNEQRIHTPLNILRRVRKVWPEGIALDPCGSPHSQVNAEVQFGPEFEIKDGLSRPWPSRTFCNPPYAELEKWFKHGMRFDEQIFLVPVRPVRKWWRMAENASDAITWLDPVKFLGFANAFPASLCLFYRGRRIWEFVDAFEDLGSTTLNDRIEMCDQGTPGQGELFA